MTRMSARKARNRLYQLTGEYVDADDVLSELDAMLDDAETKANK